MPIRIVNVAHEISDRGQHEYAIYVNDDIKGRFVHNREEPLSVLFQKASVAMAYLERRNRRQGMVKSITVSDIADVIRPGLMSLGVVGELDVHIDGSRFTSWIGKPSEDDRSITVIIEKLGSLKNRG